MQRSFRTIGLVGKSADSRTAPLVATLLDALHQRGADVILERGIGHAVNPGAFTIASLEEMAEQADLVVVIGGDGTLLATARAAALHETPMLGINLGRLGFLVDVLPDHAVTELNAVLDGAYELEPRAMLETALVRDGSPIHHGVALNDAVLHVQNVIRVIEFDTFIDGLDVGRLRADGLIVATPTGSTAYSLSAGGPILTPDLDAMIIVPICPHSLNHRPLVVSGRAVIEIKLSSGSRSPAQVALDGQKNLDFAPGDVLRIQRRQQSLMLLHPRNHHFLRMLRSKLRWGEHP